MGHAVTKESPDSLRNLARMLEETDSLFEKLSCLQDHYPDIREDLEYAMDCVKEDIEMQNDGFNELSQKLYEESRRVEELNYYVRVLEDFCRHAGIALPYFITAGLRRLCLKDYSRPDTAKPSFSLVQDTGKLPFPLEHETEKAR